MAQWNETVCVCARLFWILLLALGKTACKKTETYFMEGMDCEQTKIIGGATVYSHINANENSNIKYKHNTECRITFEAERTGWRLMLRLVHLDIPDMSYGKLCNDALYVYDSSSVYGRAVDAAGGTGGLCGGSVPPPIYSTDRFLTVYFRTDKSGDRGRGFKFVITAFHEGGDLCSSSFQCGNRKCIDTELLCDSVDHCGDFSDEAEYSGAKCKHKGEASFLEQIKSFGVTAAIVITVGTVVVFVSVVVCVICCCRQCVNKKRQEASSSAGSTTTTTATSVTINNGAPYPIAGHPPYTGAYMHHNYYTPMHQVAPPGGMQQGQVYSPFTSARDSFSQSGSMTYSSANQVTTPNMAPPSYHRAQTPTSSRSGRSKCSNESVKYADKEKTPITFPAAV